MRHTNPASQDVLDATSPFIGGTVLMGMTCSALTAGVMALGVALGEVERSRLRVLRMIFKPLNSLEESKMSKKADSRLADRRIRQLHG